MSRLLRAVAPWALGLGCGALFLGLTLRAAGGAAVRQAFAAVEAGWLVPAMLAFAGALFLRIVRWRELLRPLAPLAPRVVAGPLLAGYALNNLLPARLGELLRAHFARNRFGLSGSAVLGTIVAERTGDLCLILAILAWGIGSGLPAEGEGRALSWTVMNAGVTVLAGIALVALSATLAVRLRWVERFAHVHRRLVAFRAGLDTLRAARVPAVFAATAGLWALECVALAAVLRAVGLTLGPAQVGLVLGCVSLSTLLPSAPGFVGTLQFAFYFALGLLALEGAQGVAAATLVQLALYLPATLLGVVWGVRSGILRRGTPAAYPPDMRPFSYPDKRI